MVSYVLRPFAADPTIQRFHAFTGWRNRVFVLLALRYRGRQGLLAPCRQRRLSYRFPSARFAAFAVFDGGKTYFGSRPILLKNSLDKPLAYRRQAIFFGFSLEIW